MTNHSNRNSHLARLAPLAAAAALLVTACGSSTTTSRGDSQLPSPAVSAEHAALEVEAPAEQTPAVTEPITTDPAIDDVESADPAPPPSEPESEPDPEADPDAASDGGTTAAPQPLTACGDFGAIPPRPDSMPTLIYDTDGDGNVDDAVTAYSGGGEGWVLRVVENGVTSEAHTPGINGWAYISNDYKVDGRDYIEVTDNDIGTIFTLATVKGCVKLLDTRNPKLDVPAPAPTPSPTPSPAPCGTFGPIPTESQITSNLSVDLVGDGTADDQVITYLDGVYKLRTIRDGLISEIDVPDVGVSSIRALGVGDVGEISPGNEVIVRTGGGASSAQIGVFGHDASGCVFEFTLNGSPLAMYVGGTIGTSSGMYCGDGVIAEWSYSLDEDGTYFGSSAAFYESSVGNFTYLPASDDFSEGLSAEDLSPAMLECFDFGL